MHQLLGALLYLHTIGYAHVDVRPENLFMQSTYEHSPAYETCKLGGFESALRINGWVARGTMPQPLCGYAAPEVTSGDIALPGQAELLPRVDVFAAGVVLFMLLSGGIPPFPLVPCLASEEGVFAFAPVSAWGGVSDRAKHLVSALLDRDPEARLSASAVLEHPWMTDAPGFTEEATLPPLPPSIFTASPLAGQLHSALGCVGRPLQSRGALGGAVL